MGWGEPMESTIEYNKLTRREKKIYDLGYQDGESSQLADWSFALMDLLPDEFEIRPSKLAEYIRHLHPSMQIVERIMTQHWDMASCPCWVCVDGRAANCSPREKYLDRLDGSRPRVVVEDGRGR